MHPLHDTNMPMKYYYLMGPIQSKLMKSMGPIILKRISNVVQRFKLTYKFVAKRASLNEPNFPDGT